MLKVDKQFKVMYCSVTMNDVDDPSNKVILTLSTWGVRLLDESVWLTQEQIAELFETKRPAITKHLANIYKSGELNEATTCSILEHMGQAGVQRYRTKSYNLDAILSVGYIIELRKDVDFSSVRRSRRRRRCLSRGRCLIPWSFSDCCRNVTSAVAC